MEVRGIAFVARQDEISGVFGAERWQSFLARFSETHPFFKQTIFPITQIPVRDFLSLMEAILEEFYRNDPAAYWEMGRKSACWALKQGPLKSFLIEKDIRRFTEQILPAIWRNYFTFGTTSCSLRGNVARVMIKDLPIPHLYFEYLVMGYVEESFALFGYKPTLRKLGGVASPLHEPDYEFTLEEVKP